MDHGLSGLHRACQFRQRDKFWLPTGLSVTAETTVSGARLVAYWLHRQQVYDNNYVSRVADATKILVMLLSTS